MIVTTMREVTLAVQLTPRKVLNSKTGEEITGNIHLCREPIQEYRAKNGY